MSIMRGINPSLVPSRGTICTFSGFKSQCTTPAEWMFFIETRNTFAILLRFSHVRSPRSKSPRRSQPLSMNSKA